MMIGQTAPPARTPQGVTERDEQATTDLTQGKGRAKQAGAANASCDKPNPGKALPMDNTGPVRPSSNTSASSGRRRGCVDLLQVRSCARGRKASNSIGRLKVLVYGSASARNRSCGKTTHLQARNQRVLYQRSGGQIHLCNKPKSSMSDPPSRLHRID